MAASVRARLLALQERTGDDFNVLLVRYVLERFLYRLGRSPHRKNFVLKGAMLFLLWGGAPYRATRDLDLLGFGDGAVEAVAKALREVCTTAVDDDGVTFDGASVEAEEIRAIDEYGGVRVTLTGAIGTAVISVQVDVGFGDALTPAPEEVQYPALLGGPAPEVRAYARETVVAEKLEAIVKLGMLNTRYKDYFDLAFIATNFDLNDKLLTEAIRNTFARRKRPLPGELPIGLSNEFASAPGKGAQWLAFCRKSRVREPHPGLADVVGQVRTFAWPLLKAAVAPMGGGR
jgi:predicted nucleotidyltransferase component of viral defense system